MRDLTLMYGGLHHFVLPPPAGFAVIFHGELSRWRGRRGGGRPVGLNCSRLGRLIVHRTRSGRGWTGSGPCWLGRRRSRQPLGRNL